MKEIFNQIPSLYDKGGRFAMATCVVEVKNIKGNTFLITYNGLTVAQCDVTRINGNLNISRVIISDKVKFDVIQSGITQRNYTTLGPLN